MLQYVPMTAAGKRKVEGEVKALEDRCPGIRGQIEEARAQGDLSENAEYHAAREALVQTENRITELRDVLARAQVVDLRRAPRNMVAFGAVVALRNLTTNADETIHLVGFGEEDTSRNMVLTTSPLGQALIGKKVGDVVEAEVPGGKSRHRIAAISYPT